MIDIRNAAGLGLQLSSGQRLLTEWAAGWLADDALPPSGFSYPIRFPLSEANQRFLGLDYLPNAAQPKQIVPVQLTFSGQLYRAAQLHYRVNEGACDGTLRFDGGEIVEDLKRLTLQDLFTEPLVMPGLSTIGASLGNRMRTISQLEPGLSPYTFFPLRNEQFFADDDLGRVPFFKRQSYVNVWNGTSFVTDSQGITVGTPCVPFFYMIWVLERVLERVNYRITGDWPADDETKRRVILNMTSFRNAQTFQQKIYPGDHLPQMKCGDFLKAIRQQFGLLFSYNANARTCTIRQFAAVAGDTDVQNLTPYLAGPWGIDMAPNTGARIEEGRDPGDDLYKQPDQNGKAETQPKTVVVLGNPATGITPISLPIATTQQVFVAGPIAGSRWLVPTIRQAGNAMTDVYKTSDRAPDEQGRIKNPMPLRLLTYWGYQPDSSGNLYPLGSPEVRNARWQTIGRRGLTLTGRRGLWNTSLQLYYYFRDQARPLTARLRMPTSVLSQLALHQPVRLDLDNMGAGRFLINRVQAEDPDQEGVCTTRLELLTVPSGFDLPVELDSDPVWVELVQTFGLQRVVVNSVTATVDRPTTLSVRIWEDQQRTKIARPNAITIRLRITRKTIDADFYNVVEHLEYVADLPATNDRDVIYNGLFEFASKLAAAERYATRQEWTYQLDAGAYNIL